MHRVIDFFTETSRRDWLAAGVLAAISLAVFARGIDAEFVNFDDKDYVTDNAYVTDGLSLSSVRWAFTTFHNANWHPLTWLSLQLDASIWGVNSRGFHLTNVVIHALNAALLFLALRALTETFWRSAIVALLFADHPLRAESVAWVSERKDVLSALFAFLALRAYARYVHRSTRRNFVLVVLALALSLMCKPMFVTLPFLLLVLDWWPLRRLAPVTESSTATPVELSAHRAPKGIRSKTAKAKASGNLVATVKNTLAAGVIPVPSVQHSLKNLDVNQAIRTWRQLVVEKIPLVVLVTISAVVTFIAQLQEGAVGDVQRYPLPIRVENAAVSYVSYLHKTVWPQNLSAFYTHPGVPGEELPIWKPIASALFLAAVTGAVVMLRRRAPYLLAGWLWYVGTLVPVIGLVQVGNQAMADRYTYFPQIGVLIAICWGAADLVGEHRRYLQRAVLFAGAAAAALLAALTVRQVSYWHDSVRLWHHAIVATGGSEVDLLTYGSALQDQGEYKDAADWFRKTAERYPHSAKAVANLGNLISEEGDQEEAARLIQKALALDPRDPQIHTMYGTVLFRQGDIAGAVREHQFAVDKQPLLRGAWCNLGLAEMTLGHDARAAECYRKALDLKPDLAEAHSVLGNILIRSGHETEGFSQLQEAVRCDPNYMDGHINLGKALVARGNIDAAGEQFSTAIELGEKADRRRRTSGHNSVLSGAWYNLGLVRGRQNRFDLAIDCLIRAVELDPGSANKRNALNAALQLLKETRQFDLLARFEERLRRLDAGQLRLPTTTP
jgi:tetratricopeptide (TPR) repeat protein